MSPLLSQLGPNDELYVLIRESVTADGLAMKLERYETRHLLQLAIPRDTQGDLYPPLQANPHCKVNTGYYGKATGLGHYYYYYYYYLIP